MKRLKLKIPIAILAGLSISTTAWAQSSPQDTTSGICVIEHGQAAFLPPDNVDESIFAVFDGSRYKKAASIGQYQATAPANVFLNNPFDVQPVEVVLEGLIGDGLTLEGEYVRAGSERIDGFEVATTGIDGADYRFEADTTDIKLCNTDLSRCPQFDAVNVYYHIDRFVRDFWIDRMGVDISFQANARVHIGGDGAAAQPDERSLIFKVGNIFNKNAALSNDLIYHEYTHLVTWALGFEVDSGGPDEPLALSEGYADYFAATYTDGPRIGDWVVTCPPRQLCIDDEDRDNDLEIRHLGVDATIWNWNFGLPDAGLEYGFCLRYHELDQKCKDSYNNTQPRYVWGMIWAAMLWDLRQEVGADVADFLIVDAIRRHSSVASFAEATVNLIEAENSLFNGLHRDALERALTGRGFPVTATAVEDEPELPEGLDIQVWPNPSTERAQVSFKTVRSGEWNWRMVDMTGRIVLSGGGQSASGESTLTLDTAAVAPGVYVIQVLTGDRVLNKSLSIVRQ